MNVKSEIQNLKSGFNAEAASCVAQIFNLPYRRFVICGAGEILKRFEMAEALPGATRRYGGLQICATL
jgi:hypothetical protein